MPRGLSVKEAFLNIPFPFKGLDESNAYDSQPPLTCAAAQNVRGYEPTTGRIRGGTRAGFAKYCPTQLNSGASIQDISVIAVQGTVAMSSTRIVTYLVVAGGKLYSISTGGASLIAGSFLSTTEPVVYGDVNCQTMWYVDGHVYRAYDASTSTAGVWTASAGSLPSGARLICTWRGRSVLAGVSDDPANYFMSAVGNSGNWDYAPATETALDAVAGNVADAGRNQDTITCLIPYSDDILIFGGERSIRVMTGDPLAGGQIDLVTDSLGMAWGQPWCKDPAGTVYFFGSRGGVFAMVPGQGAPKRLGQQINERLNGIDLSTKLVRLIWDENEQGLHVFASPRGTAAASEHYWWDARSGAWWPDVFQTNSQNPLAVAMLEGDGPSDRVLVIGTRNGYVLGKSSTSKNDDGVGIESFVTIGPIQGKMQEALILKEIQATLGSASDTVSWSLHGDVSANKALGSTALETGTWTAYRNSVNQLRRDGTSFYLKLAITGQTGKTWQLEKLLGKIRPLAGVRQRQLK